jgi:hypothetical protein
MPWGADGLRAASSVTAVRADAAAVDAADTSSSDSSPLAASVARRRGRLTRRAARAAA